MSDAEDLQDVYRKTRARRKLEYKIKPEDKVRVINEIRYKRLIEGRTLQSIADEYGLDINLIHRIGAGKSFKSVPFDDRMRGAVEALRKRVTATAAKA
jgi:hypothetical protein